MGIEAILKIVLAAVLGGIIGLEREIAHKEAGLKVNVLISVGSALLTVIILQLNGSEKLSSLAESPMMAHIISAVGIIGAGVIVKERFSRQGMTSAATIWIVAALGLTVGIGHYFFAFLTTLLVILALWLLRYVTGMLEKQGKIFAYVISTQDRATIIVEIKKIVRDLDLKYINANLHKTRDGFEIEIALHTSGNKNKEFIERIMQLPDVNEITSENL